MIEKRKIVDLEGNLAHSNETLFHPEQAVSLRCHFHHTVVFTATGRAKSRRFPWRWLNAPRRALFAMLP